MRREEAAALDNEVNIVAATVQSKPCHLVAFDLIKQKRWEIRQSYRKDIRIIAATGIRLQTQRRMHKTRLELGLAAFHDPRP